jgi:hypothetical protein
MLMTVLKTSTWVKYLLSKEGLKAQTTNCKTHATPSSKAVGSAINYFQLIKLSQMKKILKEPSALKFALKSM